MLNFASQDLNEWGEPNNYFEFPSVNNDLAADLKIDSLKLFAEKLRVPAKIAPFSRPRLLSHLQKSQSRFSATLIYGRAGMGKTALAAEFARREDFCAAWYQVENADSDWKIFSRYLLGSINQNCSDAFSADSDNVEVSAMSETLAAKFAEVARRKPLLIVLDDLHSIFDAEWFTDFFTSFVMSLGENAHLLMIARTLPPLPIWRLRSKQVLGVIDEKLLAFTLDETTELFRCSNLSMVTAQTAHKRAFGKIGKLREIIDKKTFDARRSFV